MDHSSFDIHQKSTRQELFALRDFYQGAPARTVRAMHEDPWPLAAFHRRFPKVQYKAIQAVLCDLKDEDSATKFDHVVELGFRPDSYWPDALTQEQLLSRVQGRVRQDLARFVSEFIVLPAAGCLLLPTR